jgi:toxin ParE1/3/4
MAPLHWDDRAEADLDEIYDYIGVTKRSPIEAERYIDALRRACEPYVRQPLMGTPHVELGEGLRSFSFRKTYVVIYRPLDEGIEVLRVLHSAREWRQAFRGG